MNDGKTPGGPWKAAGDELLIEVRVSSGSRRVVFGPLSAGHLKVAVPGTCGKGGINRELLLALSGWLQEPPAALEVRTGLANPRKTVVVRSRDPAGLATRILALLARR